MLFHPPAKSVCLVFTSFIPFFILFFGVVNHHLMPAAWVEAYAYAGPFVVIVATLLATWALRRLHVLR